MDQFRVAALTGAEKVASLRSGLRPDCEGALTQVAQKILSKGRLSSVGESVMRGESQRLRIYRKILCDARAEGRHCTKRTELLCSSQSAAIYTHLAICTVGVGKCQTKPSLFGKI